MSGILHCEEEDNLTAFSYFLEVSLYASFFSLLSSSMLFDSNREMEREKKILLLSYIVMSMIFFMLSHDWLHESDFIFFLLWILRFSLSRANKIYSCNLFLIYILPLYCLEYS